MGMPPMFAQGCARLAECLPGSSNSQGEEQVVRVVSTKSHPNPASRLSSDPRAELPAQGALPWL